MLDYIRGTLVINEGPEELVPELEVVVWGWSLYGRSGTLVISAAGDVGWDGASGSQLLVIVPRSHDQSFTRDLRLAVNGYVFDPKRKNDLGFIGDLSLQRVVPPPAL